MEYIWLICYGNLLFISMIYLRIYKIRKLVGFQLGMNISMVAGGFLAVISGIIFIYQFPLEYITVTFVTTLIGMVTGSLFGALFDYQTLLTGYSSGMMMGIMAPMVGAAAKNSMLFLYFVEVIFLVSMILILASSKHS